MPLKWEPAIYEHKASLIGKGPAEVANSAELLTAALSKKFISELSMFSNPIAGTGILPFDFNPKKFLDFKRSVIC